MADATPLSIWYSDRTDGIRTADIDPDANVVLRVRYADWFTSPVTDVAVAENVPEDGGSVVISEISYSNEAMTFRAIGSGALITFRVSYGDSESDDFTVRLRAKES